MSYNTNINVVPTDFISNVVSFQIQNVFVDLFKCATMTVNIFDDKMYPVKNTNVTLTQEEYLQWNSDDSYIVNLVATKLGLQVEPSTETS